MVAPRASGGGGTGAGGAWTSGGGDRTVGSGPSLDAVGVAGGMGETAACNAPGTDADVPVVPDLDAVLCTFKRSSAPRKRRAARSSFSASGECDDIGGGSGLVTGRSTEKKGSTHVKSSGRR